MTRKTIAEALTAVIPHVFARTKGKPDDRLIRTALRREGSTPPAAATTRCQPTSAVPGMGGTEHPAGDRIAQTRTCCVARWTASRCGWTVILCHPLWWCSDGSVYGDVGARRRNQGAAPQPVDGVEVDAATVVERQRRPPQGRESDAGANPARSRIKQGRIGPEWWRTTSCLYYAGLRPEGRRGYRGAPQSDAAGPR
jgi:hypothetical protein